MTTTLGSVAVVGAGLIGGSVLLGVRAALPDARLVAVDLPSVLSDARLGAMRVETCSALEDAAARAALASVDLVVLASPVDVIARWLPVALDVAAAVTDCGSTKGSLVEVAAGHPRREVYVPGHPMAGNPRGGLAHARPDLFRRCRWLLCPDGAAAEAVARVSALVTALGGERVDLTAAEHDSAVALTSHLPQLLASTLVGMCAEHGAEAAIGPGYRSLTRVAGGDVTMWRAIYATNREAVGRVTLELAERLASVGDALLAGDLEPVLAELARARSLQP